MVLARYPAQLGLLLCLAITGCSGGSDGATGQQSSSSAASSAVQSATATSTPASQPAPTGTAQATSTQPTSARSTASLPPAAHLCTGTDAAQNAADAYMGALSAGNVGEAQACVVPWTVPVSLTRSLLATAGGTAVYLPRDGVDGPTVFGYRGNGKIVDVTVGKQSDGEFRVTKVAVRPG